MDRIIAFRWKISRYIVTYRIGYLFYRLLFKLGTLNETILKNTRFNSNYYRGYTTP